MIKALKDIKREEVNLFGGKATNLGFLIKNGFNVPEGFCISSQITKINKKIKTEIISRFKKLKSTVAVRSSATAEDAKNTSFAGQFDTFLNVKNEKELFKSIQKCWKSINSKRAISYLKNKKIKSVRMAVIIQKMVNADFAGVIFTIDPIYKKYTLIEIVKGIGNKLVSGEVIPNAYRVNKKNLKIVNKTEVFKLDEFFIKEISKIALKIELLYNFPQDIEFSIKNNKIYILQSRPITTL